MTSAANPNRPQEGKDTVLTFAVSENIPVERVMLTIDPAQGNFQRGIEMQSDKEINHWGRRNHPHPHAAQRRKNRCRPHVALSEHNRSRRIARRHSQWRRCSSEDYPRATAAVRAANLFRLRGGILAAALLRRPKLNAPVYDYAKLFQSDASAALVQVGAEEANASYTRRPDDRPWSERHPAVLVGGDSRCGSHPWRDCSAIDQEREQHKSASVVRTGFSF